jgi:DNA-binding PadR family transcriptional regulator
MVGEFEYLVLAAAATLGDDAYGTTLRAEIERTSGRSCSVGALYTTLDRLESKGLVTTRMGEPTAARGGRAKRFVKVTAKGRSAAAAYYGVVIRASQGVSWA